MSSPISDALRKAVDQRREELQAQTNNRVKIALGVTETHVEYKIKEIIARDAVEFYYEGYPKPPRQYERTYQLPKAGEPKIEEFTSGGEIGFRYGASFDSSKMKHKMKKTPPDEPTILDNFLKGIHPNTSVEQGDIWQPGGVGHAPDVLKKWVKEGNIRKIFMEEFKKLMK